MFCIKCGAELAENAFFCHKCGSEVVSPNVVPLQEEDIKPLGSSAKTLDNKEVIRYIQHVVSATSVSNIDNRVRTSKHRKIIIISSIFIVLSIILAIVLVMNRNSMETRVINRPPLPQISVGAASHVILSDGTLWAWGSNRDGQLGDGTTIDRNIPVHIMDDVIAVVAGNRHTFAITSDGVLWAWGGGLSLGELGVGSRSSITPVKVMDNVVYVSAFGRHSMAITEDGTLWAWGGNNLGQLGDGTTIDRHYPVQIKGNVISVSVGLFHTMAITEDGTLWGWGASWDEIRPLGDNSSRNRYRPRRIMSDVVYVSAGSGHTMAITEDGTLWGWGMNTDGQLGDGTTINRHRPIRIMDNVISVHACYNHTMVITSDGALWAWGFGNYLDDTITSHPNPVRIMEDVVEISTLGRETLAVTSDGVLWALQINSDNSSQFSIGETEGHHDPVKIMDSVRLHGQNNAEAHENGNSVEDPIVGKWRIMNFIDWVFCVYFGHVHVGIDKPIILEFEFYPNGTGSLVNEYYETVDFRWRRNNGQLILTYGSTTETFDYTLIGQFLSIHFVTDYLHSAVYVRENGMSFLYEDYDEVLLSSELFIWDAHGNGHYQVIPFPEGMLAVLVGGRWGFIDISGEEIIPPIYDWVNPFSDTLIAVYSDKSGGLWGLICRDGREVIAPIFDEIVPFTGNFGIGVLWDGIAEELVFLDENGNEIELSEDYLFSISEDTLLEIDEIRHFSEGMAAFRADGKWGFINTDGIVVVSAIYDWVRDFVNGVAIVGTGSSFFAYGETGVINRAGNKIIPFGVYDVIFEPIEGFLMVGERQGRNTLWGFVDIGGNVVVPPIYSYVRNFVGGFAAVNFYGFWGLIDGFGNEVVPLVFQDEFSHRGGIVATLFWDAFYHDGFWSMIEVSATPPDFIDFRRSFIENWEPPTGENNREAIIGAWARNLGRTIATEYVFNDDGTGYRTIPEGAFTWAVPESGHLVITVQDESFSGFYIETDERWLFVVIDDVLKLFTSNGFLVSRYDRVGMSQGSLTNTHINDVEGFSFEYPSSWTLLEGETLQNWLAVSNPNLLLLLNNTSCMSPTVQVSFTKFPYTHIYFTASEAIFRQDYSERWTNYNFISLYDTGINNVSARKHVFSYSDDGGVWITIRYYIAAGRDMYILSGYVHENYNNRYERFLDAVIGSLVFTNPNVIR